MRCAIRVRTLTAIGALVLTQSISAGAQTGVPKRAMRVMHDVPYRAAVGADPKLNASDLYLPEGKKNFPMLFFIHGGAWRTGDKVYPGLDQIAKICVDMGMGVMSVNYRLSPAVKHPTHIMDVAQAFAWLYNNAALLGADRNVIFVAGGSAGGHLAALLALDQRYLGAHGLSPRNIKGVMTFSGAYDLENLFTLNGASGAVASRTIAEANSGEAESYGMVQTAFGTDRQVLRSASPSAYVGQMGAETPPFLIAYVDDDMFGFAEQAIWFYSLFARKGLPAESLKQPGRTHATKTSGIGVRLNGADDVLGPGIKRFISSVLSGTFGRTASAVRPPQGAVEPKLRVVKDIQYYSGDDADRKLNALDIYLPEGRENVPLVFWVHGGGWTGGDKGDVMNLARVFARLGIALASTNYRVSPRVKHPTHIEDVARAFSYIYSHAAENKIDRSRIVIAGTSAGGHLVSLLGLAPEYLEREHVPYGAIKGVVTISGIYDLPRFPEPALVPMRREQAFGMDVDVLANASPSRHVSRTAPPFLITFTDWDIFMIREQSLELYHQLLQAGRQAEVVDVPGRTHASPSTLGEPVNNRYTVDDVLGPAVTRFVVDLVNSAAAVGPPTAAGGR